MDGKAGNGAIFVDGPQKGCAESGLVELDGGFGVINGKHGGNSGLHRHLIHARLLQHLVRNARSSKGIGFHFASSTYPHSSIAGDLILTNLFTISFAAAFAAPSSVRLMLFLNSNNFTPILS